MLIKPEKNFNLIKIVPSIITISSLMLGLLAIRASIDNNIISAVNFIIIASILDMLDGKMARWLNATSKFGGELDSLCDFVSFGVAPAFIIYYGTLYNLYPIGWICSSIFIIACGIRLARFNIQNFIKSNKKHDKYKSFFMGIPAPSAALLSFFPFYLAFQYSINVSNIIISLYLLMLAILMVSSIPTFSMKNVRVKKSWLPLVLIGLSLLTLLGIYYTYIALITASSLYILSIPITSYCFVKINKVNLTNKMTNYS